MIKNIHLFNFYCTERLFNKVTKEDYIKKRMSESDQYSKGYVAFLDLMGFKEMCRNYPCQEIKSIINDIGLLEIDFREAKAIPLSEEIVKRTNIKLVSDSIIITTPNDDYGLLCIIYYCAFLHIRLLKYRTLLRGGIAFGEYYCDDNTVFGPALAEAHDIESNISVYPRVVVSDYIVAHLKETKCFEGNNAYALVEKYKKPTSINSISTEIRTLTEFAEDGCLYVDYFNAIEKMLLRRNEEKQKAIESFIREMLESCKTKPKVLSKYKWLSEYYTRKILKTTSMEEHLKKEKLFESEN